MKAKNILILSIMILTVNMFAVSSYKSNKQLDLDIFDELSMYKFEVGKGFAEYKANAYQTWRVWNLIDHMSPGTGPIDNTDNGYAKCGGYYAFYFLKDNIKTIFTLIDLGNDELHVAVYTYDKDGSLLNKLYFMSSTKKAKKIPGVIILE